MPRRNPLANPVRRVVDEAGSQPEAIWKTSSGAAGLLGAFAARQVLETVRRRRSKRGGVPLNPADERMSWPYAMVWAGAVGVAAAAGRLVAQLVVAAIWKRRRRRPVAAMPS